MPIESPCRSRHVGPRLCDHDRMSLTSCAALPSRADLVIVGGGVVGAATAFYAARAGFRPLILERRAQMCTLTTPASTGAFRLQFDNLEELELVRRSVALFLNFAEVTGQQEYDLRIRQQGYLFATTTAEGAERQVRLVERQHSWGQTDIDIVKGDEVHHRFPFLAPEVCQVRFRAADGFLDPKSLTMGLAHASGADLVTDCTVTGFEEHGGRLRAVKTSRGRVETDRAVIASGPFLGPVAALAGIDLPVRPVRRQKVVIPELPVVPADAPMVIDDDTGSHWRPAFRGAYVLFTDPNTPASSPQEDVTPDHTFAFDVLHPNGRAAVARITPFWRDVWARGSCYWILQAGQYTMSPDHRPLIGALPLEGLYANGGYSGHGIMGSAAGSALLADVLAGVCPDGQNPFHPQRTFVERELDIL